MTSMMLVRSTGGLQGLGFWIHVWAVGPRELIPKPYACLGFRFHSPVHVWVIL